ncbi:FKBP-type peptidyl-prolyl cis-trans isomerase [Actinokineospora sp. HUAS TT18]|uniref:FKBP-type peptidyl-prolyl cis-trans isomerase n=1 Tax=Actinokineospora sp. HUAS TT18 TaxID=3447451 RepID=UPI003F51D1FE
MHNVGKIMIAAAVAVGLSACAPSEQASTQSAGGPSSPAAASKPAPTTTSAAAPATTTGAATGPECTADDVKVAGAAGTKPTITVPTTCAPPKTLIVKDLVPGTGKEVVKGSTMLTHYLLVTWSNKAEKDSSWSRNQPFPLENVGQAAVIDGWNEGLVGIKQGGRRLLIVPPDKGYGADGGGRMTPNETLVFVIDAVEVA